MHRANIAQKKSADGRMATEAAWLNGEQLRQKDGMLWVDRAGDRRCQAILV
jgi:hypothetical protein